LRSPDAALVRHAPLGPLLAKELRELAGGRALWTMLLILCPLVGYSFWQAVALYGEASAAAREQPLLASGLSPLDGVLVPTFGALYVAVTLLFPFVAIRSLGREKETGALRLLVQLPYRAPTLIAAKMTAIFAGLLAALVPAVSALAIWGALGGHLQVTETANLIGGHLLYGLLVGAIALFSASISESAATAAIIALAFTIGSWVLDFALAGQSGVLGWISRLSLTQTLRSFEQGLLSVGLLLGMVAAIGGFTALAAVWLHPGVPPRSKLVRSAACIAIAAGVFAAATQIGHSVDVSQDRRNSFPAADQKALAGLREPLIVTVHLAAEDPRYLDLRRAVLSKLERVVPRLTIRLATSGQSVVGSTSEEAYGVIEYSYAGRSDQSRSTSPREILPLLYALAGQPAPTPVAGEEYPGYPLVASASLALAWFFGGLPLLIVLAWWRSRRPPRIAAQFIKDGGQS
jgi:ABC-type transport system involved in multi-copper enzyme maturation permease subunit